MDALKDRDPAHIGAYTLLARLGAGGMGQVYLARSPGGRLVAIKVIRDEITDHPEALARFRREVETVRAVRSAYTANLIDASLGAAPYWLATEYVSGPTLSKAVRERRAMPAETCRGVFAALAEGLAAVHAHGVTHRDLKPQNVILAAQGPQLIDFGIARGAGQTALTEAGFAPGTPGFTAPEVLLRNDVGPAADVFALGATLAYAATGRPPFGMGEPAGVSYRAVHEPIDLAGVELELAALIEACVAKDPAARPGLGEVIARCGVRAALVVDPFYAGLAQLVEAAPQTPTARQVGVAPPARPPLGAHELPTAGATYGYTPTQVNAPSADVRRRRSAPWVVAAAVGLVAGVGVTTALVFLPGERGEQSKKPSGSATQGIASTPPATSENDGTKVETPAYVEQTNPSRDFWTADQESEYGEGACQLAAEERNEHFQFSISAADSDAPYTSGKGRITLRLKYAAPKAGESYYLSVAVKPPHEIDPDTGRPYEGGLQQNLDLGYTSKPVDLYERYRTRPDNSGVELTYPDDFQQIVNGKRYGGAIPVENDPGDWTVLFLHVDGPKRYASIACHGFTVK
ncbi:serine/threonine protein kinase [Streptomyces sp. WAC 01325]|uniref:serine/threonine-protein kinase n=1 Tax=Streptomyces sp. WAC 01325 TaxID=2203202 RepID=UPI000F85FC1A|nr:serine/threonine-protein kinase [Streptomyces sp. WAC 01325]RSM89818.1 serine/threonine protein kinase [Streptomyces sp. WAC 01325]